MFSLFSGALSVTQSLWTWGIPPALVGPVHQPRDFTIGTRWTTVPSPGHFCSRNDGLSVKSDVQGFTLFPSQSTGLTDFSRLQSKISTLGFSKQLGSAFNLPLTSAHN